MTPGPMTPGPSGMYGQQQNSNNMGYMGNQGFSGSQPMGSSGPSMGQSQMGFNQPGMAYGGGPGGHPSGIPPGGSMQNVPGAGNSKVALQNMLRARHPSPGSGQYVGNPSGQYGGNMVPGGQSMGGMNRPMYPGGQMNNMNS